MIAIGLMSGTSLDGIDAALVRILPKKQHYELTLLRFQTVTFEPVVLHSLIAMLPPASGSIAAAAALHKTLGEAFGDAARAVAQSDTVDYVASHGQTIWHDGAHSITLQLGDPFAIRERMRATVCYDFRTADCAAGGHGAPLVARVDELLFSSPGQDLATVNLGGIANLTLLPKGGNVSAFDSGPANMLLDAFVRERTNGMQPFDAGGALASRGRVHRRLLDAMLQDSYFAGSPPKTTGRERFGVAFLNRFRAELDAVDAPDGAATLAELTAASIADALYASLVPERLIVSGGGAHNADLLARIAARLPNTRVETSDAMGIPVDAKEAMAFALLGYETLRGRPANVPQATGARRGVPLGAIAPYDIARVLRQIEQECRCA